MGPIYTIYQDLNPLEAFLPVSGTVWKWQWYQQHLRRWNDASPGGVCDTDMVLHRNHNIGVSADGGDVDVEFRL